MRLPLQIQQVVDELLASLHSDSDHDLKPLDRYKLYKSFGESNYLTDLTEQSKLFKTNQATLSEADRAVAWLAVSTAIKVIPVWEMEVARIENFYPSYPSGPLFAVHSAEKFLQGEITSGQAWSNLRAASDELGPLEMFGTERGVYAANTGLAALYVTLFGTHSLKPDNETSNTDYNVDRNSWSKTREDFAMAGVKAFTSTDENKPEDWSNDITLYKPLVYDLQQRLEFWEWWLTAAVPVAWSVSHPWDYFLFGDPKKFNDE